MSVIPGRAKARTRNLDEIESPKDNPGIQGSAFGRPGMTEGRAGHRRLPRYSLRHCPGRRAPRHVSDCAPAEKYRRLRPGEATGAAIVSVRARNKGFRQKGRTS